jgi:Rod binding domain-containing protein
MSSYDVTSSLPSVDLSSIPASVKADGTGAIQTYQAALAFEQMLMQQLSQSIFPDGSGLGGSSDGSSDGSDSSSSSLGAYASMLPDALAQSVTAGGGTGLAESLYQAMKQS